MFIWLIESADRNIEGRLELLSIEEKPPIQVEIKFLDKQILPIFQDTIYTPTPSAPLAPTLEPVLLLTPTTLPIDINKSKGKEPNHHNLPSRQLEISNVYSAPSHQPQYPQLQQQEQYQVSQPHNNAQILSAVEIKPLSKSQEIKIHQQHAPPVSSFTNSFVPNPLEELWKATNAGNS